MDEELKSYLVALENRLKSGQEAMEGRIMAKINDGHERIINRLTSLEKDFLNTKGFLVDDAVVSSRRWLDMDDRVSKIERGDKP